MNHRATEQRRKSISTGNSYNSVFQKFSVKIYQQSGLNPHKFQIRIDLSFMNRQYFFNALQFNNYFFFHKQVKAEPLVKYESFIANG